MIDNMVAIVDEDYIMFIVSRYLNEKDNKGTVVSTVMSNLEFYNDVEANGLQSVQTKIGDSYILEEMLKYGCNFNGEQSGHLIFLDYGTTGDGMLSTVQLTNIVEELCTAYVERILEVVEKQLALIKVKGVANMQHLFDRIKYFHNEIELL